MRLSKQMPAQKPDVVVVDDDMSMNQAIKRLLQAAGFTTQSFRSAEALIEAGTASNAGCLVLDICLPGLSGFELHQQLIESGTRVPVIFMSAQNEGEFRERATRSGALAFLPKPFAGTNLLEGVTKALATSRPTALARMNKEVPGQLMGRESQQPWSRSILAT